MCAKKSDNDGVSALLNFVRGQAYCPCCEGVEECIDGCDIERDSWRAGGSAISTYETMVKAREALKEYKKGLKV